MRTAASVAETYAVDHPTQTRPYTMRTLHRSGFRATKGDHLRVWGAPASGYCLFAHSRKMYLPKHRGVWYDSRRGGLVHGTRQPKGGACGAAQF